jgi:hypothetical protein
MLGVFILLQAVFSIVSIYPPLTPNPITFCYRVTDHFSLFNSDGMFNWTVPGLWLLENRCRSPLRWQSHLARLVLPPALPHQR